MKFSDSDCLEVYVQECHTLSFVIGKSRSPFCGRIFDDMRRQAMFIMTSVKKGGYKQCVWKTPEVGRNPGVCMCVYVCVSVYVCAQVCESVYYG